MLLRRILGTRGYLAHKQLKSLRESVRHASAQKIVQSNFSPITVPDVTIHEKFLQGISNWPDHVAVVSIAIHC